MDDDDETAMILLSSQKARERLAIDKAVLGTRRDALLDHVAFSFH